LFASPSQFPAASSGASLDRLGGSLLRYFRPPVSTSDAAAGRTQAPRALQGDPGVALGNPNVEQAHMPSSMRNSKDGSEFIRAKVVCPSARSVLGCRLINLVVACNVLVRYPVIWSVWYGCLQT
jgi:hypothetical protein